MWDDGSGAPGRRRAGRDDQWVDPGYRKTDNRVVEYDIPTTFLPVQREPMTRPRRQRRRRPALTVLLVTAATVAIGSGAGLLMAHALDQGIAAPGASVAAVAEPSVPVASSGSASSRTVTASVPAARPSSSASRASRSEPSRTAKPTASKKPAGTTSAGPSSSKVPAGNAALEAQVLTLVNRERAKASCKPLKSNSKLVLAARRHSQFMADTGKHGHDGIGDGTPQDRIEKTGYNWRGWGENIAWGYRTASSVMDGWMNSPGHKANILNCSYIEIGVGVDHGGTNWTQDFGIPG